MRDLLIVQFKKLPRFVQIHSYHVAELMCLLSTAVELPYSIEEIYEAGLLHDIGKSYVDSSIWMKETPLTDEEWRSIRTHPTHGGRLVRDGLGSTAASDCARYHHERLDGGGYERSLAGEDIPLIARICGIVDSFDAMVSPRPYGRIFSYEEAMDELKRCAGTQFDVELVNIFEGQVYSGLTQFAHKVH